MEGSKSSVVRYVSSALPSHICYQRDADRTNLLRRQIFRKFLNILIILLLSSVNLEAGFNCWCHQPPILETLIYQHKSAILAANNAMVARYSNQCTKKNEFMCQMTEQVFYIINQILFVKKVIKLYRQHHKAPSSRFLSNRLIATKSCNQEVHDLLASESSIHSSVSACIQAVQSMYCRCRCFKIPSSKCFFLFFSCLSS